jgi:hypothetical protein
MPFVFFSHPPPHDKIKSPIHSIHPSINSFFFS